MMLEKQTGDQIIIDSTLSVVRRKNRRQPSVKVIKMKLPLPSLEDKKDMCPPVNQFNTGYLKVKKNDPL